MVAYTKPQQRKKEKSKWLRGKRDQIKFIDLRFEIWQAVRYDPGLSIADKSSSLDYASINLDITVNTSHL